MKAHIVRDPRCALLWRFDADSAGYAGVERAARLCGVTLRTVGNAELNTPVGNLCAGKPPVAAAPLDTVPELPALIVSGLSHQTGELGRFIDLVRGKRGRSAPARHGNPHQQNLDPGGFAAGTEPGTRGGGRGQRKGMSNRFRRGGSRSAGRRGACGASWPTAC